MEDGTIARPLPNTKLPAHAKYAPIWPGLSQSMASSAGYERRRKVVHRPAEPPLGWRAHQPDQHTGAEKYPHGLGLGDARHRGADEEDHPRQLVLTDVSW